MRAFIAVLILISPMIAWAGVASDIQDIDRAREASHINTSKELGKLNYVRLQSVNIDQDAKRIVRMGEEIKKDCAKANTLEALETCRTRLEAAIHFAHLRKGEMDQVADSDEYRLLLKDPTQMDTGLVDVVEGFRRALLNFLRLAEPLNDRVGLHLADLRANAHMKQVDSKIQTRLDQHACRMQIIDIRQTLTDVPLLLVQAETLHWAFAIVKAESRLQQAVADATVFAKRCDLQKSEYLAAKRDAEAALAQLPPLKRRNEIARLACRELKGKIPQELQSACARELFTPAVLYSLEQTQKGQVRP